MPDMKGLYNLEVKMAVILFTLLSCLNVIDELDCLQVTLLLLLLQRQVSQSFDFNFCLWLFVN